MGGDNILSHPSKSLSIRHHVSNMWNAWGETCRRVKIPNCTWHDVNDIWSRVERKWENHQKKKIPSGNQPTFQKNEWNTVYKTWKLTLIPYHYYVIIHVIFSVRFDFALVFHNRLINTAFSLLNPNVAAPPCSQPCVFSTCSTFG